MKKFIHLLVFILIVFSGRTQPPCGANPPAGNTCATATPICELNGYCGNTSASYTANSWSESCGFLGLGDCGLSGEFCGSIENNSFLTFVASASTISFDVWVFNSTYGDGIQIMIFSATNCSGTVTSYYCDELAPSTGSQPVSASGLTPGNTYYIMIDGFAGDVCDYIFAANTGVAIPVDVTPVTTTICSGESVVLTASGGNGTYNWTASPNLSGTVGASVTATPPTTPGTYNYTVNSATGNPLCPSSATATATITVNPCGCIVTAGNSGDVCEGTATFGLTATTVAGASYSWTGPNGFTSNVQNPLNVPVPAIPGTYVYTVTADDGTQCSSSTTLVVNPSPTINAPVTSLCIGGTTQLSGSGNPALLSPWVSSNQSVATVSSTGLVTALTIGTTTITYMNSLGCSTTQVITVASNLSANAGSDISICLNATSGNQIGAPPIPGNTYIWVPVIGLSNSNISNPVCLATVPGTTNYTVTMTNAAGCISTDNVQVTIFAQPTVSFTSDITVGCDPRTIVFTNTSPSSTNCLWTFQGYGTQTGCGQVTQDYTSPGTFDVGLTITDVNGCTNSLTNAGMIVIYPTPTASFTVSPTESTILNPVFEFTNMSVDAATYSWEFGDGSSSIAVNPSHTYTEESGGYEVVLYAVSGPCIDSSKISITIKDELIIYVPNAFTPDGDEHNNVFLPILNNGFDFQSYNMMIVNRWGEILFETQNVDVGWDGTYHGQLCKDGDYIYKIVVKDRNIDKRREFVGHFTLIK